MTKEQLAKEINGLDHKGLWHYLEKARKLKAESTLIETLVKDRCRELMGDAENLPLDGDAGVYIEYSPRYEVPLMDAEFVVQDQDMLSQILKVDLKLAEEILPSSLWLELKTRRKLKGEPTKKLMVGKIKHL